MLIPRPGAGVALRIEVDDQDPVAEVGQAGAQVDRGGGLAHAALLVGHGHDPGQRPGEGARGGLRRRTTSSLGVLGVRGVVDRLGRRRSEVVERWQVGRTREWGSGGGDGSDGHPLGHGLGHELVERLLGLGILRVRGPSALGAAGSSWSDGVASGGGVGGSCALSRWKIARPRAATSSAASVTGACCTVDLLEARTSSRAPVVAVALSCVLRSSLRSSASARVPRPHSG